MEQVNSEELRTLVRRRMRELGIRRESVPLYGVSHSTLERFLAGQRVRPEQVRRLALAVGIELGAGPIEMYEVEHVQTRDEFEERWLEHVPAVVREYLERGHSLRAVK